jgi:DNA adenine methylase
MNNENAVGLGSRSCIVRPAAARPVLKWAGGKTQLLSEILPRLPENIDTYFEPFVGGGAVFFALAAERRFRRAVLSDLNRDLIGVYRSLRDDVDGVIAELRCLEGQTSEEDFYRIRATQPRKSAKIAARVIYLNKTGYNGLYRVNRSGQFNVPFGRNKKPRVCDEPNLRAASRALSDVDIECEDFEEVCQRAGPKDAVYFDPPYLPLSSTANFTDYHHEPFLHEEHRRLAEVVRRLRKGRVFALLSNSDTEETRQLYTGLLVQHVAARRLINSKADQRGPVGELLVTNRAAMRQRTTRSRPSGR